MTAANGAPTPLGAIAKIQTQLAPLQINHVAQFPAANISFDTAPGVSLGDAVNAIKHDEAQIKVPAVVTTTFLGAANAYQASLGNELWLILAAIVDGLHRAGRALRELHPPDHHPLHPALGRRRRAARPDDRRLRPRRDRHHRHHPA